MAQPVQSGSAEQLIGKRIAPFREIQIAGQHDGAAFIAFGDQVVEVFVVRRMKGFQTEVIDDEKRYTHQRLESAVIGIGGPCRMQISEQLGLRGKQDVVTLAHGGMADGLGNVTFTRTARTDDEYGDTQYVIEARNFSEAVLLMGQRVRTLSCLFFEHDYPFESDSPCMETEPSPNPSSFTLPPGDNCDLAVIGISRQSQGTDIDQVVIRSNDPFSPETYIPLYGQTQ